MTTPGQYPYVADMTAEKAITIAGGFARRAGKRSVELTRDADGQPVRGDVPLTFPMRPSDTVAVKERDSNSAITPLVPAQAGTSVA